MRLRDRGVRWVLINELSVREVAMETECGGSREQFVLVNRVDTVPGGCVMG